MGLQIEIHLPTIELIDYRTWKPIQGNLKDLYTDNFNRLKKSFEEKGGFVPVFIWKHEGQNKLLDGHQRHRLFMTENATFEMNGEQGLFEYPCIIVEADSLVDAKEKLLIISSQYGTITQEGFEEFTFNLDDSWIEDTVFFDRVITFDAEEEPEELEEKSETPGVPEIPKTVLGDLYELVSVEAKKTHRVQCGDSCDAGVVEKTVNGNLADLGFNDPPYGMKKEAVGVLGDNMNYKRLLEFNKIWIPIQFSFLKENGSFYCWGIDEPLMDIYAEILKPMILSQKATFRNLLTWDKGHGQGQNSDNTRSYATADEKCLFVMAGVQGFNNNSDNYFEGWEPIRKYLLDQRILCGWDVPKMKQIAGHSDKSRDHWTSKSQWNLLTEEVYIKFQEWAIENGINAFKKEYDEIKKEYDEIKKEYDEIKKEYYSTRAYFNNTHDNFNNVWHFGRDRDVHEHATPKPVPLAERAIRSSCPENGIVLDFFLGSGTTLIACEKLGRTCYGQELDEKYMDVIVKRWINFMQDNNKEYKVLRNGEECFDFEN